MEFRVEGNLRWEGVVPDACARGKRIYITLGLGLLGSKHEGSRGALAECPTSAGEKWHNNLWMMPALDRRLFFRNCTPFEITSTPVESQKMPKLRQQACETNMHHLVLK